MHVTEHIEVVESSKILFIVEDPSTTLRMTIANKDNRVRD
jgi:hypothetical protein